MSEEEARYYIIELINNEEAVKEAVCETIIEEEEIKEEEIKPKPKPKSKPRAKPNIKIVKESVEPVEPIFEEIIEPIVIEKPEPPKKIYKLNKIVQCTDCGLSRTQHTLLYIHKRRGFCKAVKEEPEKHQNQYNQKQRLLKIL